MEKLTHAPRIAHFMDTKSIQELNPEHQRESLILAFEKFMKLVYYIEEKDILAPGRKKSKLQEFLNHLVKKKNDRAIPLGYFAPLLSKVELPR